MGVLIFQGHQQFGSWTDEWKTAHINVRELYVVQRFLEDNQTTQDEANCFEMDSTAAVFCLNRQGTSHSAQLLSVSEQIFKEAHHWSAHLSTRHVPGIENGWTNALSRFKGTRLTPTPHGGPDAFTEDWNRWTSVYLFPPHCSKVLLRICHKLRSFKGKVLLLAPYCPAQPWFSELLGWCLHPPCSFCPSRKSLLTLMGSDPFAIRPSKNYLLQKALFLVTASLVFLRKLASSFLAKYLSHQVSDAACMALGLTLRPTDSTLEKNKLM
ncbi:hypothetical protein Hamer_G025500 [Homarus americanus]|uniref:Uncharacterized protein n=1 Tax=Homarus americanus TaxID=6706 RepID=A0A8J5TN61_HOMAM|nr:hypothetical protein Hamer_G025500 [Homarus americanus]